MFKDVLAFLRRALPKLEKIAPVAATIAALTPWPWDDAAVAALPSVIDWGKKILGATETEQAATAGVKAAILGKDLGLSPTETVEAMTDSMKLTARALEIKKGFRESLRAGKPVEILGETITTLNDLKEVPKTTFLTLAQVEYAAVKLRVE